MSKAQEEIFDRSLAGLGFGASVAGVDVNEETAMRMSVVYSCVAVLAETVASLPLVVYERLANGGKARAFDHPMYDLLHDEPNRFQTSATFFVTAQAHRGLWGNAYAEVMSDNRGRIEALVLKHPNTVKPSKTGEYYFVKEEGREDRAIPFYNMLHVPGLGFDGRLGKSPIAMSREAISLGLAAEEFGARFFANDARPGMALVHPGSLSPEAQKRLKASWEESHAGKSKAHKVAVLEEGLKLETFGIPPEDAQFIELRKFQVEEIARIFRVPLNMIQHTEPSTSWGSGIEQMNLGFVIHTIRPWLIRWEQAFRARLFTKEERRRYFAEFVLEGLLRGDSSARGEFYTKLFNMGSISPNEIRAFENMNPIENGDTYYVPLNLIPVEDAGAAQEPRSLEAPALETRGRGAASRRRVRESYKRVFNDSFVRIMRGEKRNVMRAAKGKSKKAFLSWADNYFKNDHPGYIEREMRGSFDSLAAAIYPLAAEQIGADPEVTPELENCVRLHCEKFAWRQSVFSLNNIIDKVEGGNARAEEPEDYVEELEAAYEEWEPRRAEAVSDWETVRMDGLASKAAFLFAGVTTLIWVSGGNACEYCAAMDGATVGIDSSFASTDSGVSVEGEVDLVPSWNVVTPPLHDKCQCSIEPGETGFMMIRETRVFKTENRHIDEDGAEKIEGHAAVFNQLSEDLGGFREMIAPGAFADVLMNDVRCLYNHDPNYVIGRTASGTLELREDDLGLVYTADPPSTVWATDLKVTIGRGDVNQSSFGFYVGADEWKKVDGEDVRIVNKVAELFDVSPVTFPAYPQTDVQVRALERMGVDPDALSDALDRLQRGEELSSSDRDLIDATAKKLSEAITPEEPGVSSTGISMLKKRVDLAAIQ